VLCAAGKDDEESVLDEQWGFSAASWKKRDRRNLRTKKSRNPVTAGRRNPTRTESERGKPVYQAPPPARLVGKTEGSYIVDGQKQGQNNLRRVLVLRRRRVKQLRKQEYWPRVTKKQSEKFQLFFAGYVATQTKPTNTTQTPPTPNKKKKPKNPPPQKKHHPPPTPHPTHKKQKRTNPHVGENCKVTLRRRFP